MKKFTKAVALLAVMCMLLSTVAFAEGVNYGSATGDKATKLIDVTVANAGAEEQVVLLIIDKEVTPATAAEGDIMFIDQKKAEADGSATFEDIQIRDTETVVDIWVGSAETEGARLIGDNVDLNDVKKITIVEGVNPEVVYAEGNGKVKQGVGATITVDIPEGLTVDAMIWGFDVSTTTDEGTTTERKYSKRVDDPLAGLGSTSGNVKFAAAFEAGFIAEGVVEISNVSAIFLTGENTEDEMDHYTNEALDKANKK